MYSIEVSDLPFAQSTAAFERPWHIARVPPSLPGDEAISIECGSEVAIGYPYAISRRDDLALEHSAALYCVPGRHWTSCEERMVGIGGGASGAVVVSWLRFQSSGGPNRVQISLGVREQDKSKPMTLYWRWGWFN